MKKLTLFLLNLFLIQTLVSQPLDNIEEPSLNNPKDAIQTHLFFLQQENYKPTKAAAVICNTDLTERQKVDKATKLKQILDGKGIYINTNRIPSNPNYIDSASSNSIYYLSDKDERIYLEKANNKWCYSEYTISKIDEMYGEVFPFGTDLIRNLLPQTIGEKKIIGIYLWQYFGIIILVGLIFLLSFLVKKTLFLLINLFSKSKLTKELAQKERLNKIAASASFFIVFWIAAKFIPALLLPPKLSAYVVNSFHIVAIVFLAILAARIATFILYYLEKFAAKTESKLDDQLLPIVNNIVKFIIVIIAIALILREIGVDLLAILAGLSVGALALALAAQDTVKNFIGSITIFLDHPFEIDDYIIAGNVEGSVEEVGIRATRIKTPGQSIAYIPNGMLSNMIIDNLGLRIYRRWKHELGIVYGTPAEKIEQYVKEIELVINNHEETYSPNNMVFLNNLGQSSINIFVSVFLDVNTYKDDLRVRHELLLLIIKKGKELDVDFAFPTQTLHIEKE